MIQSLDYISSEWIAECVTSFFSFGFWQVSFISVPWAWSGKLRPYTHRPILHVRVTWSDSPISGFAVPEDINQFINHNASQTFNKL